MFQHSVRYGATLGAAMVVSVQVLTWLGLGLTGWVFGLNLVLLITMVSLAHRSYRRSSDHGMTFLEGAGIAAAMILVALLINQVYMVLYMTYIEPGWVDRVVEIRRELLIAGGNTADQIAPRLADVRASFTPLRMMTSGVIVPGLWQLLIASVITLFTRGAVSFDAGRQRRD